MKKYGIRSNLIFIPIFFFRITGSGTLYDYQGPAEQVDGVSYNCDNYGICNSVVKIHFLSKYVQFRVFVGMNVEAMLEPESAAVQEICAIQETASAIYRPLLLQLLLYFLLDGTLCSYFGFWKLIYNCYLFHNYLNDSY